MLAPEQQLQRTIVETDDQIRVGSFIVLTVDTAESEVGQLQFTTRIDEYVRRLEITVDEASPVAIVQSQK